jgi:DNA-binding beta-propeller fold protein YncE
MSPRPFAAGGASLTAALFLSVAAAQQPKPTPPLPPINPAVARLDATANGLDGPGFALAVNESAGTVFAGCEEGTIRYWHKDVVLGIRSGGRAPHVLRGHQGPVLALAWHPGSGLASAGADRKVILWDLAGARPRHTLSPGTRVRSLALSPDGKLLAGGADDARIHLWDAATGKPLSSSDRPRQLAGHTDWILCLAFSPDGGVLASGGHDGTVRLWDVKAGSKLLDVPVRPPAPPKAPLEPPATVWSLAFSPDGKTLAAGNAEAQIFLFNAADGKLIRTVPGHGSTVTGLAFHPGGAVLASASKDRTVRLWNPANGQALKVLEGHTAWVEGVAFCVQGTRLASVGADQTVRLWDLTNPPPR